jgi:hypothetical protein
LTRGSADSSSLSTWLTMRSLSVLFLKSSWAVLLLGCFSFSCLVPCNVSQEMTMRRSSW